MQPDKKECKGKEEFAVEVAERIKALSGARGMAVSNVLADLGIQPGLVTSMTTRKSVPVADTFIPIAGYFNVSIDYLFGRRPIEPAIAEGCSSLLALKYRLMLESINFIKYAQCGYCILYDSSEKLLANDGQMVQTQALPLNLTSTGILNLWPFESSYSGIIISILVLEAFMGNEKASGSRDEAKKAFAKEVSERLKALSKGMSVSIAMTEVGVPHNLASNMAVKGIVPSADTFVHIANYFNVSMDYLFGMP
jgi:transcriptional regulator with XRE-family HTH domain